MFYQLYLKTRKRVSLPPMPYRFIESLWDVFYPTGHLTLLLAEKNEKSIAGIILLKFKDRVSAEFAASDESYKKISPNHYLFWEAIKLSYNEGYKIFDFGRTAPTNSSLMDFKKRWNTKIIDLPQYYYPENMVQDSGGRKSMWYQFISKMCDKAPDPIFKLIGNFSYRHLS